jgi:hypothetical protein
VFAPCYIYFSHSQLTQYFNFISSLDVHANEFTPTHAMFYSVNSPIAALGNQHIYNTFSCFYHTVNVISIFYAIQIRWFGFSFFIDQRRSWSFERDFPQYSYLLYTVPHPQISLLAHRYCQGQYISSTFNFFPSSSINSFHHNEWCFSIETKFATHPSKSFNHNPRSNYHILFEKIPSCTRWHIRYCRRDLVHPHEYLIGLLV